MIFKKGDRIKNVNNGGTAMIIEYMYRIKYDNGLEKDWSEEFLEQHWVLDNKKVGEK